MDADAPMAAPGNVAEYRLRVDGVTGDLDVLEIEVDEGISVLYLARVEILATDDMPKLGQFIGQVACLTSVHALGERVFHGIVSRAAVLSSEPLRYRIEIVPRLWMLTRRWDCRIFQDKTTPDILREVLEGAGIPGDGYELRLSRTYKSRNYCAQYRETDFAFVSRLMEEEGICYWFAHSADGHVLTMADDAGAHDPLPKPEGPAIRYRDPRMSGGADQFVQRASLSCTIQPGRFTLRDYSFKRPSTDLEAQQDASPPSSLSDEEADQAYTELEVYDFPGEFIDEDMGGSLARVRMEERLAERMTLRADTDARRMCPGFRFALDGHSRSTMNREWLITHVTHAGTQPPPDNRRTTGPTYRNTITAIPSDLVFRPPRVTPRPTIVGLQTATVTGPSGEELHVDEYGRVKIKFHWDRVNPRDDTSSCWVRVSHPSAGAGFGQIVIPRVGQEVIIQFIEGDPDRPVVTGRVYNAENMPARGLPAGNTHSTLRSKTVKGAGYNELSFDDTAGAELIVLKGQYNFDTSVGNDMTTAVTNNQTATIGVDRTLSVGGNDSTSITGNRTLTVDGTRTSTIKGDDSTTITAGNTSWDVSAGNYALTAALDITADAGVNYRVTAGADASLDAVANLSESATNITNTASTNHSVSAGAQAKIESPSVQINGTAEVKIESGVDVGVTAPTITVDGTSISFKGAASIALAVGANSIEITPAGITISGVLVTSTATGIHTIAGSVIKLN